MKIIFSIDHIYLHGGVEKMLAEKVNYFSEISGYEVSILTTEQCGRPPCYPISSKVRLVDLGISYKRDKSYFNPVNLRMIPDHFKKQKKILRELKPDFIVVCNYNFDFYWMPFINRHSKKIKEFHSSRCFEAEDRKGNKTLVKKVRYRLNDWIEAKYDNIVVLNKDEACYYKSKNVVIIPNSVTIPQERALLENKIVIAAGRIAPVKGFNKLIEAWEIVHAIEPEWELHFYGENYLQTQQQLEKQIQGKGLTRTVFFKGSSSVMTKTLLNGSLYAMSSVSECFPMILLEALSVGLPVVSFDCPNGPRNIISDQIDGLLTENQNCDDLAKKILLLMRNEEKRKMFGFQAKINSQKFSTTTIMKYWINLLNL